MSNNKKGGKRKREAYQHRPRAVCVVAYDMHGRPMPDSHASEVANAVSEIAKKHGYLVSVTRT